ncbi:NAD(P)-binding protein [Polychaeton citri CBS 116435]|uniref:NAD(P)-binding protein n=1 Tax=Polychaeton citri CBS 116435 TaxID=1314669 RepID=A0A9P4UKE9_9PEZI|nr:NAD(P)-binding protein [Polychaeton citri CBS 116435]
MPKIFITGATGYIAGDILHALYTAYPDYTYSALVRSQEKATLLNAAFPTLRPIVASLDDLAILESEAADADIVIHAADASDNEGAAKAIAAGIAKGHSKEKPGYYIHTGGAGILTYFDESKGRLGEWEEKEFNDWKGVSEITTLPKEAFHRGVDQIVLGAGMNEGVKTAIVAPPTIYGRGRGPVSVRGRQVYELSKLVLQKQYAPIIGKGQARWTHVHVHDLSDIYVKLVEKAVEADNSPQIWGAEGYYFAEQGEHVWGNLARKIAATAAELGFIGKDPKDHSTSRDEAMDVAGFEAVSWGLNTRAKAQRARQVLGWKPYRPDLEEEIPNILKEEKERLAH